VENNRRLRSLARRADFLNLKAAGRSLHINSWLLINVQATDSGEFRCGFTLSRYTGTAVVRNRLRRWGKEYLRKWVSKNRASVDLNLIFKRQEKGFYASVSHKDFDAVMDKLAAKLERYV
jgi:ribonuclease P protein component